MKNFLNKLAKYDGVEHLKISLAKGVVTNPPGGALISQLKKAKELLTKTPDIISKIKEQKDKMDEYLLGDQSKEVFDFLKDLSMTKQTIDLLSATDRYNKEWAGKVAKLLEAAADRVSYNMSEAYTILYRKIRSSEDEYSDKPHLYKCISELTEKIEKFKETFKIKTLPKTLSLDTSSTAQPMSLEDAALEPIDDITFQQIVQSRGPIPPGSTVVPTDGIVQPLPSKDFEEPPPPQP